MMKKEDALAILLAAIPLPSGREVVALDEACGRVLAEAIEADMNLPPFNRSAMDGYAVIAADLATAPCDLRVVDIIKAGQVSQETIHPGHCAKIMTGAPVPEGADAVQMVEKTESLGAEQVRILEGLRSGQNIAPLGQDMKLGETILRPGRPLRPVEVGMLASCGQAQIEVFRRPRVTVFATGDELVPPGSGLPGPGQIRESNGSMLAAQVRNLGAGIQAKFGGIVVDNPEATRAAIEDGLEGDVLVFSGGVSMGDYDYVHHELKARGLEVLIEKVAIKPGKPLLFGFFNHDGRRVYVFGLPGNPVSSYCTFELFLRPFLRGMMGFSGPHVMEFPARLVSELSGKAIPRTQHLPAQLSWQGSEASVLAVEWHGSGDLRGMVDGNAFIVVPAGEAPPAAGSMVQVLALEPDLFRPPQTCSRKSS